MPGKMTLMSINLLSSGTNNPFGMMPNIGHINLIGIAEGNTHHSLECAIATTLPIVRIIHKKMEANMPKRELNSIYKGISQRYVIVNRTKPHSPPITEIVVPNKSPAIQAPIKIKKLANNKQNPQYIILPIRYLLTGIDKQYKLK